MIPLAPLTCQPYLDGKEASKALLSSLTEKIQVLKAAQNPVPTLAVILVGTDPASQIYVGRKSKTAEKIGLRSIQKTFEATISQTELQAEIEALNADPSIHGILIQLPLPKHLDTQVILRTVDPRKDVDGFHPVNLGRLLSGDLPPALPCTPAGMMYLLKAYNIPVAGRHAVVVGRSTIVGKPMGLLLLQQNATVTFCHSKTVDLPSVVGQGDIVVAAAGVPGLITPDCLKPGAVVLDVGINRLTQPDGSYKIVGDVDTEAVLDKVSWITPVPGGVGPMTIAMLMHNTLALYDHYRV